MARKETFTYTSVQGSVKIQGIRWIPEEKEAKAVLQIAHGMAEYAERYDDFAVWMADRGYIVTANDHLGHGASIDSEEAFGYFYERSGNKTLVQDMHKLRLHTEKSYPGLPYFMLGHSMGSFLLRQYLLYYGSGLSGCIIMGTGDQPAAVLAAGRALTTLLAAVKGWKYRSRLIWQMTFGSYNKQFRPNRTEADWLTRDEKIVDDYIQDKRCSFIFTLNAYHNLFSGMITIGKKDSLKKMPRDIPLWLVSGAEDPVGGCGKQVRQLYDVYQQLQIEDVEIKLYENDRHEILNELDRGQVYEDIHTWIWKHLSV